MHVVCNNLKWWNVPHLGTIFGKNGICSRTWRSWECSSIFFQSRILSKCLVIDCIQCLQVTPSSLYNYELFHRSIVYRNDGKIWVNMSRSSNVYTYYFVVIYLKLTWPRIGWVYYTYIDLILSKNAIWYVSLELSYKYKLYFSIRFHVMLLTMMPWQKLSGTVSMGQCFDDLLRILKFYMIL